MRAYTHIIVSAISGVSILIFSKWINAVLFFVGGVLIDFDHYLNYIFRFKNFNFRAAYKYCETGFYLAIKDPKKHYGISYFHNLEFLVLILLISIIWNEYFIFLGIILHYLMDLIDMARYRIFNVREVLFCRYFFRKLCKRWVKA